MLQYQTIKQFIFIPLLLIGFIFYVGVMNLLAIPTVYLWYQTNQISESDYQLIVYSMIGIPVICIALSIVLYAFEPEIKKLLKDGVEG